MIQLESTVFSISMLSGLKIMYRSWNNEDKEGAISYPNDESVMKGLNDVPFGYSELTRYFSMYDEKCTEESDMSVFIHQQLQNVLFILSWISSRCIHGVQM